VACHDPEMALSSAFSAAFYCVGSFFVKKGESSLIEVALSHSAGIAFDYTTLSIICTDANSRLETTSNWEYIRERREYKRDGIETVEYLRA
jgi:hypothetical protein